MDQLASPTGATAAALAVDLRTATAEQRGRIFDRLQRRNRLVSILRVGVPVVGVIFFAGLIVQLFVGSLGDGFSIGSLSIDRDHLVIEAPSYTSVGSDGTTYSMISKSARMRVGANELVELTDATVTAQRPGGGTSTATAEAATLQTADQLISVPGLAKISDSDGNSGTLAGAEVDFPKQFLKASGPMFMRFANGSTIASDAMTYDAAARRWTFQRVTVTLPDLPDSGGATP